jgi:DHA1 family bicyclomycin/chloramphenicol resistance-like MFS transporter
MLPETVPHGKRVVLSATQVLRGYQQVFADRELLRLITAVGANFAGFFIYVLAAPVFLIQHLGLNEHQFGWMFIPTVCGMVFGSWLARRAAGKLSDRYLLQLAYGWMAICVLLNLGVCYWLPANPVWNIAPIALYNIGMALAVPVLSVAALDRHAKLRGTIASAQAFMQMLLSTVSAGLLVPLLWFSPGMLAVGATGYLVLGWACVRSAHIWRHTKVQAEK